MNAFEANQSVSSYQVALGFCKAWICGWLYLGFPAHQRMADGPMGQVGTDNTFPATCRLAHSHSPSASQGRESPQGCSLLLWVTQKQVSRPQVHTTNWGGLMSPGRKTQPLWTHFILCLCSMHFWMVVLFQLADLSPLHDHRSFKVSLTALSLICVSDPRVLGPFECVLSLHWPHKVVPLKRLCAIQ